MDKSTVLIIEDDQDIVSAMETILSMENYTVHTSFTGKEGLSLATDIHPNIILVDYMLPDINGDQIIKSLLKTSACARTPKILLSATHDIKSIAQALPVSTYIRKPFELVELLTVVEKYTSVH